jgi:hypothetical protein
MRFSARTIKESCPDQILFFDEDALRNTSRKFITHYHVERNHQRSENRLIVPLEMIDLYQGAAARLDRGFNLDEVKRFAIQEPVKLNLAQQR